MLWKMGHWNEYEHLIAVIRMQLEIMADEFEKTNITMSSLQDAKRMRLASKLLKMFIEEHYHTEYLNKHWDENKIEGGWMVGRFMKGGFDNSYSIEDSVKASNKDWKALNLALKIISQDIKGWWQ